ncbi:hypothetical protein AA309_08685 [Microvirga vignae]|uniref:Polysaccharide biosynthesis protein C-terminal domain-containing protein n=1 Tax=Microvirga vignae TaxID=1225564 RepID=A0A0H1REA0_9HYPH|nr:lipopolysaccharide biosynthesis protein [Microvirga vignae]KLK93399.1 hypothetical protein AA309_08685 [Microvirga vignae]
MSVGQITLGLETRSLIGFFWIFSGSGALAVVRILVLAVLARILMPADFGIVGAAMVVVTLGEVFARVGVAPSIVQMRDLTEAHIRTGFTLSVLFGVAAGAVTWLLAPLVASLFQMPALEPVVQALAFLFPIRSISIVSEGLVQRQMRYKAMAATEFVSYLLGYAPFAISAAALGFGFWALVVGQVAQTAILSAGFMLLGRHTLRPLIDGPIAREIAHFGFGTTVARIGNHIAMNADYFIIGRWLGPAALGIYTRAFYFVAQPTNMIGAVADKVLFPAMASIQDKNERLNRAYVRAIGLIAMVSFPVAAFLIALAPEIVRILLGHNWDAAVLPFQILLLSLPFRTAYKLTSTLLRASGFVYTLALWQWIYAASVVTGAIAGTPFGINGVGLGVSTAIVLNFWLGLAFASIARKVPVTLVLRSVMRHLALSTVILALMLSIHHLGVKYDWPAILIVLCGSATAACFMLLLALFGRRVLGAEGEWLSEQLDKSYRRIFGQKQQS